MWPPYELLLVFRLTCCHQLVRGPNWKLREVYQHLSIRGGLLAEEVKVDDKKQQKKNDKLPRIDRTVEWMMTMMNVLLTHANPSTCPEANWRPNSLQWTRLRVSADLDNGQSFERC
ncbi:hypothetical protein T02_4282 [Trichinella nativa]|uniref:Uncharacterized protein n=1 Tax=Trichinella nativa TaxID=6335 RepID=A0A0V1L9P4_9BILA|nr:hypothetical protein T02_4282 [Trichinella nativa]